MQDGHGHPQQLLNHLRTKMQPGKILKRFLQLEKQFNLILASKFKEDPSKSAEIAETDLRKITEEHGEKLVKCFLDFSSKFGIGGLLFKEIEYPLAFERLVYIRYALNEIFLDALPFPLTEAISFEYVRETYHLFEPDVSIISAFEHMAQKVNQLSGRSGKKRSPRGFLYKEIFLELEVHLAEKATAPFSEGDAERASEIVHGFLECLLLLRIVNPFLLERDRLRIVGRCDSNYLLNNLFGFKTSIKGLNFLFEGGLPFHWNRQSKAHDYFQCPDSNTALICGRPGTGKTTLALQLAADIARQGATVLFYSLEQSIDQLKRAIYLFNWNDDELFLLLRNLGEVRNSSEKHKGVIAIKELDNNSLLSAARSIKRDRDGLPGGRHLVLVIDSIHAIEQGTLLDEGLDVHYDDDVRIDLNSFLKEVSEGTALSIFVGEESPRLETLPYLVGTVIHLTTSTASRWPNAIDYSNDVKALRMIEIGKARSQHVHRGTHHFTISKGSGIKIFPSIPSVLSVLAERQPTQPEHKRGSFVSTGVKGLDQMISGRNEGLEQGSLTLLKGEFGSGKTLVGLCMLLSARPCRDKERKFPVEHTRLVLSFRGSGILYRSLVRNTPYLRRLEADLAPQSMSRWECLELPLGYISGGEVLDAVQDLIRTKRRSLQRISRILVDDLCQLDRIYPLLSREEAFLPALLELLRSEGITTILIETTGAASDKSGWANSKIASQVGNAIHFRKLFLHGETHSAVNVEKTQHYTGRRDLQELRLDQDMFRTTPSLEAYILQNGLTKPLSVILNFYAETDAMARYNRELEEALRSSLPGTKLKELSIPSLLFDGRLDSVIPQGSLKIMMISEFRIQEAAAKSLVCLDDILDEAEKSDLQDTCNQFLPDLMPKAQGDGNCTFALPYYLDWGVVCYNKELFEKAGFNDESGLPTTWRDWLNASLRVQAKTNTGAALFDFPRNTSEKYNVVFFEVLFSLLGAQATEKRCPIELLGSPESIEAVEILYDLTGHLRKSSNAQKQTSRSKDDHQDKIVQIREAVFWRQYLSTVSQLFELGSHIGITALPGNVTLAAEWYIGIAKRSASPHLGWNVIKRLTAEAANFQRLGNGIGMPVSKVFYDESASRIPFLNTSFDPQEVRTNISQSYSRGCFACYGEISGMLAMKIRQLLHSANKDQIGDELQQLRKFLERRIAREGHCAFCKLTKESGNRPEKA